MPFNILGIYFRGLLSVAILSGGVYLLTRWYDESRVPLVSTEVSSPPQPTVADKESDEAKREREAQPATAERVKAPSERRFRFDPGWNKATAFLALALALLIWGTLGRLVGQGVGMLTKARPKPGVGGVGDSPRGERTGEVHWVDRPDGSKIRVECYGPADAPPIVFTHGWGSNSTAFFYPKMDLTDKFRLILWDEPGMGLSKKPDNNDYRMEKLAADLQAVLTFAGDRPVILVGHSIGGMILLTFCRAYREVLRARVAGLVLVHTTYKDPVKTTSGASIYTLLEKPVLIPMMWVMIALWPLFWVLNWLSYFNGSAHKSTASSSFAGTETQDQLNFCARFMPHARPDVLARGMLGMIAYDETATLATIDVPTLVVVGDKDTTTPPDAGRTISDSILGAELAILSPARHFGLMEQHRAFDPLLARFGEACFAKREANRPGF